MQSIGRIAWFMEMRHSDKLPFGKIINLILNYLNLF